MEITATYKKQQVVILVDDADYPAVSQYHWNVFAVHGNLYARSKINGKQVYLHRFLQPEILGLIDHANGNSLDNQRENIRAASYAQNSSNRGKNQTKTTSKYKGVFPDLLPGRSGWSARICANRKKIYIGHYQSEIEAARAYDQAAQTLQGEYAVLNFPA
jgi:hypothetical protein